jgi:16S rRNA (cytosine1402-N4)-methyltransferase
MVDEVTFFLRPERGGWIVDATVGLGGHAEAMLVRGPACRLLGIDQDREALALARARLARFGERVALVHGDFRDLQRICGEAGVNVPRGILFDLGLSSYQLAASGRGFSFEKDEPLDMRMDPTEGPTAAQLLNQLSETELARILFEYGQERHARRIARAIAARRQRQPIQTTRDLVESVKTAVPRKAWSRRIHVATRSFQAFRIFVNQELSSLAQALPDAARFLQHGGRLAVISFHSLEDRIVKQTIRALAAEGEWAGLEPAPIVPTDEEVRMNPRSRSARLRVVERLSGNRHE